MNRAPNATPSIGDSGLKLAPVVLIPFVAFLLVAQPLRAEKRTIKWVATVYNDDKGIALKYPEGVACTDDYFIIADTGNGRLLRFAYRGEGVEMEAEFPLPKSYPIRVHVNSNDDLFFLDGAERRIETMSATGEGRVSLSYGGLPFSTEVVPKSFAIDSDDNIYVLDIFSRKVLVLEPDGQFLRQVPFPEKYGFFTDLTVDRQGTVFLLDGVEAVVYSAARSADRFSRLTDSLKAYMNFPASLALDAQGVMYLVDQYGSGLGLVGPDGAFLGRKLGLGWKDGGLYYPSQICVSGSGRVFIADRSNSRVQLFDLGKVGLAARTDEARPTE
jgi:hypothetical protein